MSNNLEKGFVEAIEDGKIVTVREDYARREKLMILRRGIDISSIKEAPEPKIRETMRARRREMFEIDRFRRPLSYKDDSILDDLIPNFHWEISSVRKAKNLTRKQFAQALNVTEDEVKMIENGVLPQQDFVLINKIQTFFGINLRKDGKDFMEPARKRVDVDYREIVDRKNQESKPEIFGEGIEIEDQETFK